MSVFLTLAVFLLQLGSSYPFTAIGPDPCPPAVIGSSSTITCQADSADLRKQSLKWIMYPREERRYLELLAFCDLLSCTLAKPDLDYVVEIALSSSGKIKSLLTIVNVSREHEKMFECQYWSKKTQQLIHDKCHVDVYSPLKLEQPQKDSNVIHLLPRQEDLHISITVIGYPPPTSCAVFARTKVIKAKYTCLFVSGNSTDLHDLHTIVLFSMKKLTHEMFMKNYALQVKHTNGYAVVYKFRLERREESDESNEGKEEIETVHRSDERSIVLIVAVAALLVMGCFLGMLFFVCFCRRDPVHPEIVQLQGLLTNVLRQDEDDPNPTDQAPDNREAPDDQAPDNGEEPETKPPPGAPSPAESTDTWDYEPDLPKVLSESPTAATNDPIEYFQDSHDSDNSGQSDARPQVRDIPKIPQLPTPVRRRLLHGASESGDTGAQGDRRNSASSSHSEKDRRGSMPQIIVYHPLNEQQNTGTGAQSHRRRRSACSAHSGKGRRGSVPQVASCHPLSEPQNVSPTSIGECLSLVSDFSSSDFQGSISSDVAPTLLLGLLEANRPRDVHPSPVELVEALESLPQASGGEETNGKHGSAEGATSGNEGKAETAQGEIRSIIYVGLAARLIHRGHQRRIISSSCWLNLFFIASSGIFNTFIFFNYILFYIIIRNGDGTEDRKEEKKLERDEGIQEKRGGGEGCEA